MNEIHGSWFDPSNPVVKYSGSLQTELFEGMVRRPHSTPAAFLLSQALLLSPYLISPLPRMAGARLGDG